MIDYLINHLNQLTPLTKEEKHYLRLHVPVQTFQKKELLLTEGAVSKAFYFVISGCVRWYYLIKGEEKTAFFYTENTFISSYESFTKQTPANHYLQAIETTQVATIYYETAYKILALFPKFEFLSRALMEEELIIYQDIIASFVAFNPEQRYLNFLKKHPKLLQRIPQYYIATYLGVTPETLSRIRRRVASK